MPAFETDDAFYLKGRAALVDATGLIARLH